MIGHTPLVLIRYIFLVWKQRKTNDSKTLGMIFDADCSEVKDIELETALKGLLTMVSLEVKQDSKNVYYFSVFR